MPFRNSLVAAVIATATTGRRIVIDALASIGSVIEFYTGEANEVEPARLLTAPFESDYSSLTVSSPLLDEHGEPASIALASSENFGTYIGMNADQIAAAADRSFLVVTDQVNHGPSDLISLEATTVQLTAQDPPGFPFPFAGVFVRSERLVVNHENVLQRSAYTPELRDGFGAVDLGAGGMIEGSYVALGRNVWGNGSLRWGSGPKTGTGVYRISLPFPVADPSADVMVGSCWATGPRIGGLNHSAAARDDEAQVVWNATAWSGATPFGPTNGGRVSWQFQYERQVP